MTTPVPPSERRAVAGDDLGDADGLAHSRVLALGVDYEVAEGALPVGVSGARDGRGGGADHPVIYRGYLFVVAGYEGRRLRVGRHAGRLVVVGGDHLAGPTVHLHVHLVEGRPEAEGLDDELAVYPVVQEGVGVAGYDHVHEPVHLGCLVDDLAGRLGGALVLPTGVGKDHDGLDAPVLSPFWIRVRAT